MVEQKMGIFKKLNLKDQEEILVLQAPASFEPELEALENVAIKRDAAEIEYIDFCLVFAAKQAEVDAFASMITQKARGDAVVWFAYPKGSSKKYKCDFNRDRGWDELGRMGFEPVRQVSIDKDWSALRFRRVEYIKTMTRHADGALTEQGKKRTGKNQ